MEIRTGLQEVCVYGTVIVWVCHWPTGRCSSVDNLILINSLTSIRYWLNADHWLIPFDTGVLLTWQEEQANYFIIFISNSTLTLIWSLSDVSLLFGGLFGTESLSSSVYSAAQTHHLPICSGQNRRGWIAPSCVHIKELHIFLQGQAITATAHHARPLCTAQHPHSSENTFYKDIDTVSIIACFCK